MSVMWLLFLLMILKGYNNIFLLFLSVSISIVWLCMNIMNNLNKSNTYLMNLIGLIIILFLLTKSMWLLYIYYELSMLPIVFLVLSYGSNMSRIPASLYMSIYTVMFSLPAMIILMMNFMNNYISLNMNLFCQMNNLNKMVLLLMFLVKIPMFLLHYWLPKAHVEASTLGSMVLASGLLKMGGYGAYKLALWMKFNMINSTIVLTLSVFPTVFCFMQVDFKKMIALMSVSHMTLTLASLLTMTDLGLQSFILLNVTHVLTSSLLFYFSGLMYSLSKTRMMYMFMMFSFKILFILMILSLFMNISTPPFFSMISELLNMSTLFYMNYNNTMLLIIMVIFSSVYTLLILNFYKYSKSYMINYMSFSMFMKMVMFMMMMWFFI